MSSKGGTNQACAACKHQRRRCSPDCPLAPYFPADQPKTFRNAHRLYGVRNILEILNQADTREQKDEAMKSVIYESNMREKFPVYGCYGITMFLYYQLMLLSEEYRCVEALLANSGEGCHDQVVDHNYNYSPRSPLQFDMSSTCDALFEADRCVMNGVNGGFVESDDDVAKSFQIHHPNFSDINGFDAIQYPWNPFQTFLVQQETEVDHDGTRIETVDD